MAFPAFSPRKGKRQIRGKQQGERTGSSMSLLKNFVEPETTDSSGISESDEELPTSAEMDEGVQLPDKDCTTPEMYAASYTASCALVEEDALAFLANGQLPVINVPTLRDLGKHDLRTFLVRI